MGDLRGSSCKSGTGEAIRPGSGEFISSKGKEGADPGWEERQLKSTWVIWVFVVDVYFLLLKGSRSFWPETREKG